MASTLTKILIHITFSTKNRVPLIDSAIERRLYEYVGGICRRLQCPLLDMNGTNDHVHMLVSLAKTVTLSDLMLNVKRDSSRWMNDQHDLNDGQSFQWQDGYFAFSIGESNVDAIHAYFASQKEHHQSIDFKDEVRAFLRKYGVEWNEEYVWG